MNVALHPEPVNIISLCSGGGGLDFGIELAIPDARPVVLVEGEAWSVATLVSAMEARLMAPAPVWSNVRTFDGRPWRGLVDGVIGGIPCQPHSLAGKRGGSDDERDLWSPTRRIIVQSGAWWVLIENVRGMLSAKEGQTAGAHRVWRDLQRLGFEVEIGLFTAAEVGASHERERVFILAVADGRGDGRGFSCERYGFPLRGQQPSRRHDADGCGAPLGHPDSARLERRRHQPDGRAGERAIGAIGANGGELGDTQGDRWREGRTEPELRRGRNTASGPSADVVNAVGSGHDRIEEDDGLGLYPPRPSDIDGWRRVLAHSPHLEPAVRRMADGVAARLDLSGPHAARIERLRMLGNGVVPLEAAYALRTLATRLARRSAGAARLVRMMVNA